jgi:hypothetical protein
LLLLLLLLLFAHGGVISADSKFPSNLFQRQFVSALANRHRIHTICHIGYIPWAAVTGAHNIFFARDAEQIMYAHAYWLSLSLDGSLTHDLFHYNNE